MGTPSAAGMGRILGMLRGIVNSGPLLVDVQSRCPSQVERVQRVQIVLQTPVIKTLCHETIVILIPAFFFEMSSAF